MKATVVIQNPMTRIILISKASLDIIANATSNSVPLSGLLTSSICYLGDLSQKFSAIDILFASGADNQPLTPTGRIKICSERK